MLKSIKSLLISIIIIVLGVIYFVADANISDTIYWDTLKFPSILLVILILIKIINKVDKLHFYNNCDYYKDVDNLVSPEIAEFILDNKIDTKNVLMTLLLNLKLYKNIDFISNNKIILLNKDNLSDYEQILIDTIFKDSNEFDLKDLNSYFTSSNEETRNFFKNLNKIKAKIKNNAYSMNLYNLNAKRFLNFVQLLLLFICTYTTISIIWYPCYDSFTSFWYIYIIEYILFICCREENMPLISLFLNHSKYNFKKIIKIAIRIIFTIFVIVSLINNGLACLDLIIYLIDFIIIFSLCNTDIFTDDGKYEQKKVIGFKKYLENYSLLEEKDTLDATVWEKYLVYATAFGIPDKIINKTNETSMKFNIFLQLINNFLHTN